MNATNAEMIAAVEQWARATGWHLGGPAWTAKRATSLHYHVALVWALTEATLGSCKACHGRGTWDEWQQQIIRVLHADESMLATVARARAIGATYSSEWTWEVLRGYWYSRPLTLVASRSHPCPACLGLGNAGQRLLDAQPIEGDASLDYAVGVDDHFAPGWQRQQESLGHFVVREDLPDAMAASRHGDRMCARFRLRCFAPAGDDRLASLTVLADQLQARGEPLGLYLAHLLAAMRGKAIEDACTSEAVEALRRLTPAPRPGGRLLTSLSIEGEVLRVSYRSEPHGSGLGYRTLLALPPCIVDIGDPVRQRVLLHFAAATTLYDLALQIETQTYGLVTYIDEAARCVNVHERVHMLAVDGDFTQRPIVAGHVAVDAPRLGGLMPGSFIEGESMALTFDGYVAQVATFNADTSTSREIIARINASIEGVSARAGERGEIVLAADQARGASAWDHVPLVRAERLRPSERDRRRRQRGRDLSDHHRRDRAPRFGLRGEG